VVQAESETQKDDHLLPEGSVFNKSRMLPICYALYVDTVELCGAKSPRGFSLPLDHFENFETVAGSTVRNACCRLGYLCLIENMIQLSSVFFRHTQS
jgi:hypothetical protein